MTQPATAAAALATYREAVAPPFAAMLDEATPLRSTGARVVAAAAAADRGDAESLSSIQHTLVAEGVGSAVVDVWMTEAATPEGAVAKAPAAPVADPLAEAERVGRMNKAEGFARALAAEGTDGVARAALLLSFANDLRSVDATRRSLQAVEELDAAAREQLEG